MYYIQIDNGFSEDQIEDPTDTKDPSVQIREINQIGSVTISFSEAMFMPNYKNLIAADKSGRHLQQDNPEEDPTTEEPSEMLTFWNKHKDHLLELSILESPANTFPRDLSFEWSVTDFSETKLELQMQFKDVVQISSNLERDILQIQFKSENFFMDRSGNPVERDTSVEKAIPSQLKQDGASQVLEAAVEVIGQGRTLTLSTNYAINILLAGSLNQLWALINSQQIIVLFPLYRVNMPANAGIYYHVLM